jgi:hypothetical protein
MRRFIFPFFIGLTLSLLQACGGGGEGGGSVNSSVNYSGSTSVAEVDTTNSEDLGTASASAARQAVVTDAVNGVMRPAADLEDKVLDVSPTIAEWIAQSRNYAARTEDVSRFCTQGGEAIANTNDAETSGTITFTNCGIDDGNGSVIVMTGAVDFTLTLVNNEVDSMSLNYNVSVTYEGKTAGVNLRISCVDMTGVRSCSITSDFVGLDNRVYRVTNITVSGSASSGYYVDATVYDPAHGSVSLTTTSPLLIDCPTGVPSTGTVVITGANSSSATVSFDSCDQFTVTVNGLGEIFYW